MSVQKASSSKKVRTSPLGAALVEEGTITEEQLKRSLKVQALLEQPKHLGAVLIELGYATRQAISDAVARIGSTLRLGDILVEQGLIPRIPCRPR